jgi:hypothetical protein
MAITKINLEKKHIINITFHNKNDIFFPLGDLSSQR